MDPLVAMDDCARLRRFGLGRFRAITRMHPIRVRAMLHDLEDAAIQDELEFL